MRGFGKNYFTLASIQAHSCAMNLHKAITAIKSYAKIDLKHITENKDEDPPPQEALQTASLSAERATAMLFFKQKPL